MIYYFSFQMGDVDPETLLEWLSMGMGQGDERDMQLIALEQLCMLLLMSDNVDRCFESCPPRTFLPALCKIFLDELAPENVLEVTARAITYYLDVSAECTRRIVAIDGAIKAICNRLVIVDLTSRTSRDLAEQCIKVLELICSREAGAVFEGGGLNCVLSYIRDNGSQVGFICNIFFFRFNFLIIFNFFILIINLDSQRHTSLSNDRCITSVQQS
jgi:E3 ubiquitin-protein ligase HECTD1